MVGGSFLFAPPDLGRSGLPTRRSEAEQAAGRTRSPSSAVERHARCGQPAGAQRAPRFRPAMPVGANGETLLNARQPAGALVHLVAPPCSRLLHRAWVSAPRLAVRRPGAGRRRRVGAAVEGGLDAADGIAPDRMRWGDWPRGARSRVPSLARRAVQVRKLDGTVCPETCQVERACRGPAGAGGGPGWACGGAGAGAHRLHCGRGPWGAVASPFCPVRVGRFRCVL